MVRLRSGSSSRFCDIDIYFEKMVVSYGGSKWHMYINVYSKYFRGSLVLSFEEILKHLTCDERFQSNRGYLQNTCSTMMVERYRVFSSLSVGKNCMNACLDSFDEKSTTCLKTLIVVGR